MSWKKLACVAMLSGLLASAAVADPSVTVTGVENGGNIDWTVFFAPDEGLFADNPPNGVGGSLAVEFAFEVADTTLQAGTLDVNEDFMETINSVVITNPGNDPYAGDIVEGAQTYAGVSSVLDTGTVDAIFAPLGSTYFTSGGDKEALSFTTTGTDGSVTFGGLIAQAGTLFDIDTDTVPVGPGFNPGDFSGDGAVDQSDLSLLLANWGATVPPSPDGWDGAQPSPDLVDQDELSALLANWGVGVGSLAASGGQVPEPSTVITAVLCCVGLGLYSRRRVA